ncbi:hypothetical protein FOXB_16993 [Fusarium oxysporum f. sp. conglutinans Fo5176]|uniref:PiggyBac transposable element-derived protein domain-containing protein n=1 Tax=Fusarium oxysporum (strain Fo5176) TaxID=660025 RepID=F9GEA9_FUSOF|nr:hypothetical protein FOXB_16993 [Fusarium oxysporum f. sp. conglutinans Fo5176]
MSPTAAKAASYHVFLDNLFSSSNLFRRLRQLGHGATGTLRRNCGLYRLLVKLKADDNTAAVNQIAWKDNALVLFLSTVFTGNERVDRIRKRPTTDQLAARPIQEFFGEEPVKVVSIPSIAATYNDEMNAVDRGDQMRAYWGPDRRVRRGGWRALAWDFLLEIALINSFILYQRGNLRWELEKSQAEWRQRLVNDLVAKYEPSSQSRQRFRTGGLQRDAALGDTIEAKTFIRNQRQQRGNTEIPVWLRGFTYLELVTL